MNKKKYFWRNAAVVVLFFTVLEAGVLGCSDSESGGGPPPAIAERPLLFFDNSFSTVLQNRVTKGWLAANVMGPFWTEVATDMEVILSELYPRGYGLTAGTAIASQFKSFEGGSRLVRLAMAYLLSDDLAYAQKVAELMPLYIADDPYNLMLTEYYDKDLAISGWVRGFSVAFDWTYQSGELGSLDDPESVASAVANHVYEGCDFLANFLASGGYDDNHDVISASALALGAVASPEFNQSKVWITQARAEIEGLLSWGLGMDGDWFEGAFRYQGYMLAYLMQYIDMMKYSGGYNYLLDPVLGPKLRAALQDMLHFTTPTRENVAFNDVVRREIGSFHKAQLFVRGATELEDGSMLWLLDEVDSRYGLNWREMANSHYFTDTILYYDPDRTPPPEPPSIPPSTHFDLVDYSVFRTGWDDTADMLAFDMGPGISHDHCDKGSFELYYKGVLFVPDAGARDYNYPPEDSFSKPTQYHNTLARDGQNQLFSEEIRFDLAGIDDHYDTGSLFFSKGYAGAYLEVDAWDRSVLFATGDGLTSVILLDEISDANPHNYEYFMHARGTDCVVGVDQAVWTLPKGHKLSLTIISPAGSTIDAPVQHESIIEMVVDMITPPPISMPYEETRMVRVEIPGTTIKILSLLIPRFAGEPTPTLERSGESYRLTMDQTVDVFTVSATSYGVSQNGDFGYVRGVSGSPAKWMLQNGTSLSSGVTQLVNLSVSADLIAALNSGELHGQVGDTAGGNVTMVLYFPLAPTEVLVDGSAVAFSYDVVQSLVQFTAAGDATFLVK